MNDLAPAVEAMLRLYCGEGFIDAAPPFTGIWRERCLLLLAALDEARRERDIYRACWEAAWRSIYGI